MRGWAAGGREEGRSGERGIALAKVVLHGVGFYHRSAPFPTREDPLCDYREIPAPGIKQAFV